MATTSVTVPAKNQRVLETRNLLTRAQNEIIKALPAHLRENDPKADRFRRIILSLVNAKGMENIAPDQFVIGAIRAAEIGLEPDPLFGQLYLVPFGKILQPLIGYRGMIELALRSGRITSVRANLAWPEDDFQYETGLDLKLRHVPNLAVAHPLKDFDDPEKRPICAYAVAVPRDSSDRIVAVLSPYQILQRKSRSKFSGANDSPWKNDTGAMWLKTAVRALSSWMPQCQQLAKGLAIENEDVDTPAPSGPSVDVPWYEVQGEDEPEPKREPEKPEEKEPEKKDPEPEPKSEPPTNGDGRKLKVDDFTNQQLTQLQRDLWMGKRMKPTDVQKWIEEFQGTVTEALSWAADAAAKNGRS